jgi:hypothetical protein
MNGPNYTINEENIREILLILSPPAALAPSSQPGSGVHTPKSASTQNASDKSILASPAGAVPGAPRPIIETSASDVARGLNANLREAVAHGEGSAPSRRASQTSLKFNRKTPRKSRKNSTLRKRRI